MQKRSLEVIFSISTRQIQIWSYEPLNAQTSRADELKRDICHFKVICRCSTFRLNFFVHVSTLGQLRRSCGHAPFTTDPSEYCRKLSYFAPVHGNTAA